MSLWQIVVALISAPMCLAWIAMYLRAPSRLRALKHFKDESPPDPARWPKLSVIVPACNEAETIEQALLSLRAQTYPNLEIIVIDDRSTDATGAILDRLAASDPRFVPVHIHELPEGWLGKVHALDFGTKKATGELLLYTDADVIFTPQLLEKAVAFTVAHQLDHFSLLPDLMPRGFVLQMMYAAFGSTMFTVGTLHDIGKPGKEAWAGVGAFNLVRRAALERTEGFEWLRMEPSDDFALGLLLYRHQARAAFRLGFDELAVRWYPTAIEMVRGLEKNTFGPLCGYSYAHLLLVVAISLLMITAPFLAVSTGIAAAQALGVAAILSLIYGMSRVHRTLKISFLPSLFVPAGHAILLYAVVRAALLCAKQGGVRWRGTRYATAELARGRRISMMSGRVKGT